jgi:XisI protein
MDKLAVYRKIIKQMLMERAELMRGQPLPGEEILCLFEEETDNYILLRLGWVRGKRLYSITLHLRLVNGKIHLEQDWTEDAVAELIAAGVPREEIVLAFNPPELRQQTEFAVA